MIRKVVREICSLSGEHIVTLSHKEMVDNFGKYMFLLSLRIKW